jgi:hypothetical protein
MTDLIRLFDFFARRKEYFYKKYAPPLGHTITENSLAISLDFRYVYTRIYKSANSTVTSSLYYQETGEYIDDIECIQAVKDNFFKKPSQLNKKEVSDLCCFFKFTVVRNPYSRFLSCYLDKIKPVEKPQRAYVLKFLNKAERENISINDFLTYLENGGIRENGHWAPQYDFLIFPIDEYNKICFLENLQNDLNEVLNELYGSSRIVSVVNHKTNANDKTSSLNDITKKRIRRLYIHDFDYFGY